MTTWSDIDSDPNSPSVMAWQRDYLTARRAPVVANRVAYLQERAAGRSVLDIGVVEHRIESLESDRWLHRKLAEVAARIVGVDVLEDGVAELVSRGFDARVHDLCASPMDEQFELAIAGEVIEHVGSPEPFVANIAASLVDGGSLILTTPNPYQLHRVAHYLRGGHPDSADHLALYAPSHMAALAHRAGCELVSWRGIALKRPTAPARRAIAAARTALSKALKNPELNCDSLIYEIRKR